MANGESANGYRMLAELLDGLSANGVAVERVETGAIDGDARTLSASLEIEIPLDSDGSLGMVGGAAADPDTPNDAAPTGPSSDTAGDGAPADTTGDGSAAESATAPSPDAGAVSCDAEGCSARFDSDAAREIHAETAHRRPDIPAHRNEAALEIAYREYDSFPRMTEALGVDVTAQTVRRNMMKAGIHDPSADGDGDGDDSSRPRGNGDRTPDGTGDDAADGVADGSGNDSAADGPESATDPDAEGTEAPESEATGEESAARGRRVTDGAGAAVSGNGTGGHAADRGESAPEVEPRPVPDDGLDAAVRPLAEASAEEPSVREEASGLEPGAGSLDLPDGVWLSDLRKVATEARTLRQAAVELDRSRDETRDLLRGLGLLNLVHGRVSTALDRDEREARFEEWLAERRGETPADDSDE